MANIYPIHYRNMDLLYGMCARELCKVHTSIAPSKFTSFFLRTPIKIYDQRYLSSS